MIREEDLFTVGKFQKTHALKGELNAILDIDPDFVESGHALIVNIDGMYIPFFCETIRQKGTITYLLKLEGINSENEAKEFVNKEIYALRNELAPFYEVDEAELKEGDDFIGYELIDDNGHEIGEICKIDDSTQNLLFIVETGDGSIVYVPAAEEWIIAVDDDNKTIIMKLPEGLLDLNSESKN